MKEIHKKGEMNSGTFRLCQMQKRLDALWIDWVCPNYHVDTAACLGENRPQDLALPSDHAEEARMPY